MNQTGADQETFFKGLIKNDGLCEIKKDIFMAKYTVNVISSNISQIFLIRTAVINAL